MIMMSGLADTLFGAALGAAKKTLPGTALTASNGAGAVFSMILAGMKGDPSRKGVQSGQVPLFNNSKSGNLLSSGRSLSLAPSPKGVMSATEPAGNPTGLHRTRRAAVAGSQIPENAGDLSGGSSVAANLESMFLTRGISLEKIVLEKGDFEFLDAVLEKMGFSQPRIDQFFKQMMETRSDGSITLADFFRDLITFEQDEKSGHGIPGSSLSGSLDKSAIPHLELILRDMGVSAEKMNQILANAASENGALDMNKLVFQLKQYAAVLEKNAALKSNQTSGSLSAGKQTDINQASMPSARNMADGLSKLGISVSNRDADTPFSLKAFIAALEQQHQGSAQATKPAALNTAALTDSQNEMPALRSMEMEKIHTFFGFAREMMFGSKHNQAYDLSQGRMSVHPNQAKDGISLGQVSQLLKEAGIAPEKISAILTSAAQQSNAWEIKKPVSDLKKNAAVSDYRATAAVKNSDQIGLHDKVTDKNIHTPIESHQQIDKLVKEIENGGIFHKDPSGRQGILYDGIAGMDKPQTTASSLADLNGLANFPKNMGTLQNMPLPASVMNQVGKEIAGFVQRGDRFFTLQLKPPELGMVNIEMDVKENVLKLSIVTETGSAKDLLQANYAELRRVLQGYGVKVEAFDIQLSGNQNQSATNGDNPSNHPNHHSRRFENKFFSPGQAGGNDTEQKPAPQLRRDGLVDLLA